jgi:hypothetical protein
MTGNHEQIVTGLVTVGLGIVAVATIAVLVSQGSNTPSVLGSFGQAFGNAISTAVCPITGNCPVSGYSSSTFTPTGGSGPTLGGGRTGTGSGVCSNFAPVGTPGGCGGGDNPLGSNYALL